MLLVMTPDKHEKVIDSLAVNGKLSMVKLVKISGVRRNDVFDIVDNLVSQNIVRSKHMGRERIVSLVSQRKSVIDFIRDYQKRLHGFEKSLEKEIKTLEKNLPLVSRKQPLINVKTREPVLELDKKTNVWRDMGKTRVTTKRTFKVRPNAEKQFAIVLNLLHKLYQESSALNYSEPIVKDHKHVRDLQKKSKEIILKATDKISKTILEKDPISIVPVQHRIQNVLYGLIYKASLDKELEKA